MIGLLLLLLFGTWVGGFAPSALARARWAVRAPRAALALWLSLWLAFATAVAMTVHTLTEPGHLSGPPLTWLARDAERMVEGPTGHRQALLIGALVLASAAAVVGPAWFRAARARARHRELLDLVARQEAAEAWWTVEDPRAVAWCVPGRGGRVILSRGALELLDAPQRAAVLAHERAHLSGRHHLPSSAAGALGRALPRLPLARAAAEQIPVLIEMAADDRALRHSAPHTLATALCAVATAATPPGTLAAGHLATAQRVRRLLPVHPLPRPLRTAYCLLALALPTVPVLLACGP
ncbi:M56 family metallopeptidase [Kitasatospora azatica]|uniref:M56 family metallopeptidase n=1 Tax=Kitasatospora azatica TaxID=58347 RepID=UPI00068D0794|nr:M56 family metallopeptidase [Kitasatospora azatica]